MAAFEPAAAEHARPYADAATADLVRELEARGFTVVPPAAARAATVTDAALDDDATRAVDQLLLDALDDDAPPAAARAAAPRPAAAADAPPAFSEGMLALASAVMDAQGPRPTYSSFASSIPADHPFADG